MPVAVDSGRLWGRGWVHRSGIVTFMVGDTIPPGLKRDATEARVHPAINALESPPQPRAWLLRGSDDALARSRRSPRR